MHTACVWSEKLPFAGYSIVKEPELLIAEFGLRIEIINQQSTIGNSPINCGGEYRARTGDLLDANQALSQLS